MVFPFQRPTNFPSGQMPMRPGPMQRMPGNPMFPSRGINGAPSGNFMQNMLGRFLQPQNLQQGGAALPTQAGGGLTNTLNNVQQVLKMVQSTAPVVQQYGPMVKNIPAMFRMMKALKDTEDEPEESTEDPPKEQDTSSKKEDSGNDKNEKQQPSSQPKTNTKDGESKPMLFI
ncbi:hypothetical protein KK120_22415 [Virgibacillus dakarensis]|nr:hypothetical protein [Virgibacillus dakarensis]